MIFWFLLAGFFLVAVGIVLIPLFRYRNNDDTQDSHNLDVYKAQLRELEADQNNDLLNDADRTAARLEIERRLLKVAAENEQRENEQRGNEGKDHLKAAKDSKASPISLITAITMIILLISTGLYLVVGKPGMPDFILKDQAHSTAKQTQENPETPAIKAEIATLEAHLKQNPNDSAAWRSLGQNNIKLHNKVEVAKAFERFYTLEPNNIDAAVVYAESLITLSNGHVGPATLLMLDKAQKLHPENPGVRHYRAVAEYQAGRVEQALKGWQNLEAESTENAPWLTLVRAWILRAQTDLGIQAPNTGNPNINQVEQMSSEEQENFIKSMVARLQDKMEDDPTNIEGWFRLAKAYSVLGQTEDAIKSLESAYKYAPDDQKPAIKKQLEILKK